MSTSNKETEMTSAINIFTRSLFKKGYWQILMFFIVEQCVSYTGAFIILSGTFTSGKMNFECKRTKKDILNDYIPVINQCVMTSKKLNKSKLCNSGFEFKPDKDFVFSSVIEDFQLICDRNNYNGLAQSLVMAGLFFGGILGPVVADKFGRRLVVFGSFFAAGILGILTSFVDNFSLYLFCNFVLGILREASLSVGFIFGLEFIPDTHQSLYGMYSQVLWSVNVILLGIMAYFIRYWRYLQLIGSIPILLMSFLIVIVPESPRWLITTARFETLRNLIDNFVNKVNKHKTSSLNNIERLKSCYIQHMRCIRCKEDTTHYSGLDIFQSKLLMTWSLILILSWVFMVIAYFSMTMMTVHFPGNKYFIFLLPICLEIPGYFTAYFLLNRSRNITYLVSQLISGFCFVSVGFVPLQYQYLKITLIVIGKFCLAASFYMTIVTSIYIFPTTMRSFGTSLPSAISKLLSTFIPYFIKLYVIYQWLPTFLIGCGAVLIGLLNIFYPDWVNRPFPETLRELNLLNKKIGFKITKRNKTRNSQESTFIILPEQ